MKNTNTNINNLNTGGYIEENMVFSKNYRGDWEARFACADGFCYSVSGGSGNGRQIKSKIKDQLIHTVTHQTAHPVMATAEN